MLYSAEQYQTILDEHRNGISLAKGIIAGLVAASLAMQLEPELMVTYLKDKELLEGMLEAVDDEGDSYIDGSTRRNMKAHKAVIARWTKECQEPTHRGHGTAKGRKVAEEEDAEDLCSVVDSSDSEEERPMTRSGVQSLKGAAKLQGLTTVQAQALGNALVYGKVQPDDLKLKKPKDRADPRLSDVAKSLRKMKARTWEVVSDKGDLTAVREYFQVMASSAKNLRAPEISVKVHEWFNTTAEVILGQSAHSGDKEVAELKEYINKYYERYYGLGLPVELDYELLARGQARRHRGGGSSDEEVKGMKAELDAARGEVKRLMTNQAAMLESLKQLKFKVDQKPTREGDDKGKKCFLCGGDHLAKDCPKRAR